MAGEFVIGTTDFGIDPETVIFDFVPTDGGSALLTVEFESRREDFDRIRRNRGDEWEWASFPPSFYLRDFPVPMPDGSGAVTVNLDREAYREYEVALYMMEHNTVEGAVTITDGRRIDIIGSVELIGKPTPFRIRWVNVVGEPGAAADGGA